MELIEDVKDAYRVIRYESPSKFTERYIIKIKNLNDDTEFEIRSTKSLEKYIYFDESFFLNFDMLEYILNTEKCILIY